MLLNRDKAWHVFKKVQQIREEYRAKVLNGDSNVVSVVDLKWVIEGMYGITVELLQQPFEGRFIRGLVERRDDGITIRVKQNMEEDQKRFTAVKEMCHRVIDEPEDWSTDGVGTIKDLLTEYALEGNGQLARKAIQSEEFAEIAAVELLYPFECRIHDMDRIGTEATSLVKIATYHRIPVSVVGKALETHYHNNISKAIWDDLAAGK